MKLAHSTTDLTLDSVLTELVNRARPTLGVNFISAYLQGSFATGGWNVDSDVDFLIVIERQLKDEAIAGLQ